MFGEAQVRTGYLIVGCLRTRNLRNALINISAEFDKIKPEALVEKFAEVVGGSPEDGQSANDGFKMGGGSAPGEASGAMSPRSEEHTSELQSLMRISYAGFCLT